jgi:hypothetical protein
MKLLIVIVNEPERIEDFFSALVALDVAGLQVMDSVSVMEALAREAPIFAGLRQLVTRPKAASKTIFGMTSDDQILSKLSSVLRRIGLDLDEPGTGYGILLPIQDSTGEPECLKE